MSEPFLGEIMPVGFNFPPRGWATCTGQLLAINEYQALFSLLGTTYGGDGRTTFGLPELRGRVMIGVGEGPGLSDIRWGARSGGQTVTLSEQHLPQHNHPGQIRAKNGPGDETSPNGTHGIAELPGELYAESPDATTALGSVVTQNAGGNQQMNILNPFLGLYVCIALTGIFPSRN